MRERSPGKKKYEKEVLPAELVIKQTRALLSGKKGGIRGIA